MKSILLTFGLAVLTHSVFADLAINPLVPSGADPTCVYKDGYYYYSQTTGGLLEIRKTRHITGVDGIGAAADVIVFSPPGPNNYDVWAPELKYINGNWYVYYAADDGSDINHRMYVAKADTQDPMGTWTYIGRIYDPFHDYWAIDGNVIQKSDGSLYFVYSGHANGSPGNQYIYIAPMSNPWTISGPRVQLGGSAYYSWEYAGSMLVNEAPAIVQHNGVINIVYSANGTWTDNYCLGLLANSDGNLLNPGSWTKNSTPILQTYVGSDGSAYAPGSCTFTTSIDGSEDWILFHTAIAEGAGENREVHAQKFTWTPGYNTPNLGVPIPDTDPVAVPSGENVATESTLLRTNGAMTSIAVLTDTSVYRNQQSVSNGTWSGWTGLGGYGFKKVSSQVYPDNRLAVFGVGYSPVWVNTETTAGGSWSGWSSLGGPSFSSVKSAMYSDKRLVVAAVGDGTAVWINAQTAYNGSWGGWGSLSGSGFWSIDLVHRPDDRMVVFAVGDARVWVNEQVIANGSWTGWTSLNGGPNFTNVRAVLRPDGTFVLFANGIGSSVWVNAQTSYEGSWSGWSSLGGSGFTHLDATLFADGHLEVFGTGDSTSLWRNKQLGYQSSWNGWENLGGTNLGCVSALMFPDGKQSVFAHSYGTGESVISQSSSGSVWGSPVSLGGTLR